MRKDVLNRFKKAINSATSIENFLKRMASKSNLKYMMLYDAVKEITELKTKMILEHEACKNDPERYICSGILFEKEVIDFYDIEIKYYRRILNLK